MKWIIKILTLLGIGAVCTACYGTPYDKYRNYIEISGEITDENGDPIEGIRVTSPYNEANRRAHSDVIGYFSIGVIGDDGVVQLEFDDIDGAEKGGDFASNSIVVSMADAKSQKVELSESVVLQLKQ